MQRVAYVCVAVNAYQWSVKSAANYTDRVPGGKSSNRSPGCGGNTLKATVTVQGRGEMRFCSRKQSY